MIRNYEKSLFRSQQQAHNQLPSRSHRRSDQTLPLSTRPKSGRIRPLTPTNNNNPNNTNVTNNINSTDNNSKLDFFSSTEEDLYDHTDAIVQPPSKTDTATSPAPPLLATPKRVWEEENKEREISRVLPESHQTTSVKTKEAREMATQTKPPPKGRTTSL